MIIFILIINIILVKSKPCEYFHNGDLIQDIKNNYKSAQCYNSSLKCFQIDQGSYCIAENIVLHNNKLYINCDNFGDINWDKSAFDIGAQKWLHENLSFGSFQPVELLKYIDNDIYFVDHIYGGPNPWHGFEDLTHLYEIVTAYETKDLQIVFLEDKIDSIETHLKPYSYVWETFSNNLIKMKDFINKDEYLLIRRATFNIYGGLSILSREFRNPSGCKNSPFINGLMNNVIKDLPNKNNKLYIYRGILTNDKSSSRFINNEIELMNELSKVGFTIIDMATLTDKEQIKLASSATTMVGLHGAGLAWAFFMPSGSLLIEIEIQYRCTCFTNLATWKNHKYIKIKVDNYGNVNINSIINNFL